MWVVSPTLQSQENITPSLDWRGSTQCALSSGPAPAIHLRDTEFGGFCKTRGPRVCSPAKTKRVLPETALCSNGIDQSGLSRKENHHHLANYFSTPDRRRMANEKFTALKDARAWHGLNHRRGRVQLNLFGNFLGWKLISRVTGTSVHTFGKYLGSFRKALRHDGHCSSPLTPKKRSSYEHEDEGEHTDFTRLWTIHIATSSISVRLKSSARLSVLHNHWQSDPPPHHESMKNVVACTSSYLHHSPHTLPITTFSPTPTRNASREDKLSYKRPKRSAISTFHSACDNCNLTCYVNFPFLFVFSSCFLICVVSLSSLSNLLDPAADYNKSFFPEYTSSPILRELLTFATTHKHPPWPRYPPVLAQPCSNWYTSFSSSSTDGRHCCRR